jgi:two-component system, NtrC family, sensor histidine kinase KinB
MKASFRTSDRQWTDRKARPLLLNREPAGWDYSQLLRAYELIQDEYHACATALATAAHDLRTPLTVVAGYLDIMATEKLGDLNEKQREMVEIMRCNMGRLNDLVSDFLSFSAFQSGHAMVHREPGDLNQSVAELCQMWLPRFEQKQIALYTLLGDVPQRLTFDQLQIQRVVANLLENALKFSRSGATVWVTSEAYELDAGTMEFGRKGRQNSTSPGHEGVRISISDNGPGIPPQYQQDIFGDFVRFGTGTRGETGMGLGLAICRRIVHAHGGRIWVESEPGAGSTFRFFLPYAPCDPQRKRPAIRG